MDERRLAVATIVTGNEMPQARVLADSLAAHQGEALTVLVVDDSGALDAEEGRLDVLRPADLGISPHDFAVLAVICEAADLCAAVKPWLIELLLERGAEAAMYLDADAEVFAPIDEIGDLASEHGIVIVPHAEQPVARDQRRPTESTLLVSGVFDPAFVAVGEQSRPFLAWWKEQIARDCRSPALRRTGERWFEVPCHVLHDPAYNIAHWNLHGHVLGRSEAGYTVDGRPLRLFRFTGYDPDRPELLFGGDDGRPRLALGGHPVVGELCQRHGERLHAAGWSDEPVPYGLGRLDDGIELDGRMRTLYREALARAESAAGDEPEPPNPFLTDGARPFRAWLAEPVRPKIEPIVSRYLARVWFEQPVLRAEFPDLTGETALRYLHWCATLGAKDLPRFLVPGDDVLADRIRQHRLRRPQAPPTPGVNLVGYLDAVLGLGEVGRVLGEALGRGGLPVVTIVNPDTMSRRELTDRPAARRFEHDLNVICVTADSLPGLAEDLGPEAFASRRTAGVWFWEVDRFPESMWRAFDLVDEVWVASDFVRRAIEPVSPKPVHTVPVPVPDPSPVSGITRSHLGLPEDRFVFCFTYDFLSVADRKNPYGLAEAYMRSFDPDDGAALLLKSINGDHRIADLERLRQQVAGRPDVIVLDRYLPTAQRDALMALCDAYASLHRSEGLGLTMAEAMARGKPVVATRYSGNLTFMDDDVAYLVDATVREVGPGQHPYPADAHWAEPDLDHAVARLREVFDDPVAAAATGARAAARIRERHSVEAVAPRLRDLVDRARCAPSSATWRGFFMRGWRVNRRANRDGVYAHDWLPDGTPFDVTMERAFVAGLEVSRLGVAPPPPDPDAQGGSAATVAWLNEPILPLGWPVISRYLRHHWLADPELQARFPLDPRTRSKLGRLVADPEMCADPYGYLAWVREHWLEQTDIPYQLVPRALPRPMPEWLRVLRRLAALATRRWRVLQARRR